MPAKEKNRRCAKCGARLSRPGDIVRCDECGQPMCPECDSRDPRGNCPRCGGYGWPLLGAPGSGG